MPESSTLPVPSPRPPGVNIYATLDGWDPDGPSPRQRISIHVESQWQCGHGCLVGHDRLTGRIYIFPLICHKWTCKRCAPLKRWLLIRQIQSGKPNKFITLTWKQCPGDTPREAVILMKKAWPKLVQCIRREYGDFQSFLGWELTKQGFPHAHILARCGYIPQRWLSAQCDRLMGSPVVDIRKVNDSDHAARYVTKYVTKGAARTAAMLDGLRLFQFTQRFLPAREPSPDADRFKHCEWHHTSARLNAVLSSLPHSVDDWGFTQNRGGGVTVDPLPGQPRLSELVLQLGDTIMAFDVSQANAAPPLPAPPVAAPLGQPLPF
ncbi:unnamed protein product [marine sediment metagenome]|uniref:Replication-associated protein ORF2/G2P domain-containing protein n=1 Tax=marine sediment metagenome TaxID=412755 RepID=X1Q8P2_9ZZZZ